MYITKDTFSIYTRWYTVMILHNIPTIEFSVYPDRHSFLCCSYYAGSCFTSNNPGAICGSAELSISATCGFDISVTLRNIKEVYSIYLPEKNDLIGIPKVFLVFSLITKLTNFVKIPIFIGYPILFCYFTKMS